MQSARERYEELLKKYESIRENLHLVNGEKLDEAVKEIEKLDLILKQLEDLYGEELL